MSELNSNNKAKKRGKRGKKIKKRTNNQSWGMGNFQESVVINNNNYKGKEDKKGGWRVGNIASSHPTIYSLLPFPRLETQKWREGRG